MRDDRPETQMSVNIEPNQKTIDRQLRELLKVFLRETPKVSVKVLTQYSRGIIACACLSVHTCMCAKLLQSCPTLCNPMNCDPSRSFAHGFSRQEYWSGLSCPYPGNLPDLGIEAVSPALKALSLLLSHGGSPGLYTHTNN